MCCAGRHHAVHQQHRIKHNLLCQVQLCCQLEGCVDEPLALRHILIHHALRLHHLRSNSSSTRASARQQLHDYNVSVTGVPCSALAVKASLHDLPPSCVVGLMCFLRVTLEHGWHAPYQLHMHVSPYCVPAQAQTPAPCCTRAGSCPQACYHPTALHQS